MSLGVNVVNRGLCRKMSDIRINDRQRQFVALIAQGETAKDAARQAGFADHRPLMVNPIVRAAMLDALQAELVSGILPLSLNVLRQALTSDDISLDKRAAIAKTLVAQGLLTAPENNLSKNANVIKPLHEMTRDELRSQIEKMQSEVAERAKPAVIDGQAIDN